MCGLNSLVLLCTDALRYALTYVDFYLCTSLRCIYLYLYLHICVCSFIHSLIIITIPIIIIISINITSRSLSLPSIITFYLLGSTRFIPERRIINTFPLPPFFFSRSNVPIYSEKDGHSSSFSSRRSFFTLLCLSVSSHTCPHLRDNPLCRRTPLSSPRSARTPLHHLGNLIRSLQPSYPTPRDQCS